MSRGTKEINDVKCSEFCTETSNYVCQNNNLITGKQSLPLNSLKLIRAAMMQVVSDDIEFKPYVITINQLSKMFGIHKSNLYREVDEITNEIIKNPVFIKNQEANGKISWVKIPWISICEYRSDAGIVLQLNERLKPFLLKLKENGHYTQYELNQILGMKSTYSIRIFELVLSKIMTQDIPRTGAVVELFVQDIRESCDCEDKYLEFKHLRSRVIEPAITEINNITFYRISYEYIKTGRSVTAIRFKVNTLINNMLSKI